MFIHDDVRTLTAELIRERCGRLLSVVVGSPPCQEISAANRNGRGVDGDRLFFEFIRIVAEVRPAFFAAENSPRLRARGYDRVAGELEALGYAVEPWVVGADDCLAPHERKRVWVVGYDPDAYREGQFGRAVDGEMGRVVGQAGHAYETRLALGTRLARNACAKCQAIVGTVGRLGLAWNSGPAGHFGVADGIEPRVAKALIEGIGDAVLSEIPEAIGRVMARHVPTDGTVLDLFTGMVGGWSEGMHRAGYRTVAMCEIDPWRRSVLEARWGPSPLADDRETGLG